MRKIFIDAGGNNGCSVRKFRKKYDERNLYEIYSFEPNEKFFNCYSEFTNHKLIKSAVWTHDGKLEFYLSKEHDAAGSSLYKDKIDPRYKKSIIVDNGVQIGCIDFSNWIVKNFNKEDEIILKMDIEGAEYEVLRKMITDGSIEYIDRIYIEWHYMKIPGVSKQQHLKLISDIPDEIDISHWDALR